MTENDSTRDGYDSADDGTVYWTISLYIPSENLSKALGLKAEHDQPRPVVTSEQWRKLILNHDCSVVLSDAVDPLFNDIADRDVQGNAQEFLISADNDDDVNSRSREQANDSDELIAARTIVLKKIDITFEPQEDIYWVTEGNEFKATPPGLNKVRNVTLKRFWFAHYGGALSYHLSFYYKYRNSPEEAQEPPLFDGYVPANYYFLSMLQKLVAPKEFPLNVKIRRNHLTKDSSAKSIFDSETSIKLLDQAIVRGLSPGNKSSTLTRFWEGIEDRFNADAAMLLQRMETIPPFKVENEAGENWREKLLPDQPVIEVPGLWMPRCRFMFFFQDKRFFNLLMPIDGNGKPIDRKSKVKSDHYQRNLDEIKKLKGKPLELDHQYWQWVGSQNKDLLDYLFLSGFNQNIIDFMNQDESEVLDSTDPLYPDSKDQAEERFFVRFANHRALTTYVPASRSLEIGNDYIGTCPYAFLIHVLAMHNEYLDRLHEKSTVERLESIEDIVSKIERCITGLRSTHGNEAIANENPLQPAENQIEDIEQCINKLHSKNNDHVKVTPQRLQLVDTRKTGKQKLEDIEQNITERLLKSLNEIERFINRTKLDFYLQYQRYRYPNPFRYDTEAAVFDKLEKLRGTNRKQRALETATINLEDHARDLSRQNKELASAIEEERHDKEAKQREQINLGLSMLGFFGLVQVLYGIIQTHLQYVNPHDVEENPITLWWMQNRVSVIFIEAFLAGISVFLTLAFICWFGLGRFIKNDPTLRMQGSLLMAAIVTFVTFVLSCWLNC